VTEADAARKICLAQGARLEILLKGSQDALWSQPLSDSASLSPVASGKRTLVVGVTGGFFVAAAKGSAQVTAGRDCAAAAAGCAGRQSFRITVTVA